MRRPGPLLAGPLFVFLLLVCFVSADKNTPDGSLPQNQYSFSARAFHHSCDPVLYEGNVRADGLPLLKSVEVTFYNAQGLADNALRDDYDQLIAAYEQAVQSHDIEQLTTAYKILHDMDYYLLRYWGELTYGIRDTSTLRTYYGALLVWSDLND